MTSIRSSRLPVPLLGVLALAAALVVPALAAGGTYTTTLNAYDNLQIASNAEAADLSGTKIGASAPVAVFGGHQCLLIPVGYGYCDHLEEQMMPLQTWGTEYVAARHPPRGSEGVIWRFIAAENGTTINFDPASVRTGRTAMPRPRSRRTSSRHL